jgi:hypothetical protein
MIDVSGLIGSRRVQQLELEKQKVKDELEQTRLQLRQAYAGFNNTGDFDLIDSYVYEINSLQCRQSYLIRQIRELESTAK